MSKKLLSQYPRDPLFGLGFTLLCVPKNMCNIYYVGYRALAFYIGIRYLRYAKASLLDII